ncbi:nudix hydrolase 12, mitochondrial-like isoform X1 [Oryza brachyantha]|uniref:nudix hydrolase 12, mitochondrial-like isoform X1 n=1 Tax=Oryza brachyantha TaxID=4533 RepID=UPI0007766CC4|nr:nudix hydrolase 12, mitochondrial-like isoform X1 [Oryza brachyantha]
MSSPDKVIARTGRLRQRYDNEYRLVAGCVPYRVKKDDEGNPCSLGDDPQQVEVLMISTPNRADMVFPKGGWEDDEDVYQAASREAMEEAGVKGIIDRTTLGHWVFKSKSSQNSSSPRGACKGYIFAMEVTEELESWPEQATHGRRWVSHCPPYNETEVFTIVIKLSMEALHLRIQKKLTQLLSLLMVITVYRSLPVKPTNSVGTTGCGRRSPRCWSGCR